MSLALYPAIKLGKTEQKIRESISRLSTGLNILAGGPSGGLTQGLALKAEAAAHKQIASSTSAAHDILLAAESALFELSSLATRLKQIGLADTDTTNSASDTAALNAEAVAVKVLAVIFAVVV